MTMNRYPYDEPLDLIAEQMSLELDVKEAGAVRYHKRLEKMAAQGKLDNSSFGSRIIAKYITSVADKIELWCAEDKDKSAGANRLAAPFLRMADPRVAAMLGLKAVLARIFGEAPSITSIAISAGKAVEEETRLTELRKVDRAAFNGIMKAAADKNRSKSRSRTATMLADRSEQNFQWDDWSDTVRAHVGMVIITIIKDETGLFTFQTVSSKASKRNVIVPTEDAREWITQNINFMQYMKPELEPMIVKPKPWVEGELDGGYLTSHIPPQPFVKTRNKRYLEELKYADMPIVLEAINAAQNTPWRINKAVLQILKDCMKTNLSIAGLPRKDYIDVPPKPHDINTNAEARRAWAVRAREVHEENVRIMSKKISVMSTIQTAEKYSKYERIYMPANVDFRGRVYFLPQLSIQGPDYIKGILEFSEGKRIGEDGIAWLKYHIANLFGVDKVTQSQRIEWVDEHTEELLRGVHTPFGDNIMWHEADDPIQAYAAINELHGVVRDGPDHITRIPIALDGSCSGIQHLSMGFRDEIGGASVNLLPQDMPADIYAEVASKTKGKLERIVEGREDGHPMAKWWLDFGVDRKVCKRNCMTFPYSSKQRGFSDQLLEDILKNQDYAHRVDIKPPMKDLQLSTFLAKLNYESVRETVVKAGEAMEWMSKSARVVAKCNLPINWTTPLGFPVIQAYRNFKPIRVETNLNGKRITMSLREEQLSIDSHKSASAIAPNFVHSLDATHLQLLVYRAKQEGMNSFALIHDSFGVHACDTPRFYGIIREAFVEMYEQPVFEKFKETLEGQLPDGKEIPDLPEYGSLDIESVLDSHYCFA